jgi:hypothetical protein
MPSDPTAILRYCRKPAGLLSVAAAITLLLAGVARAGSYVINDCPTAGSGDAGPWTVFGGSQADKGACGDGAGDWIGPLGASMAPAALDGVTVTVPPGSGITIHEVKVWWAVPSSTSGATTFAIASTTNGTVGTGATPLDRTTSPDDFVLPSSSTWFTLADYCSNDDAGAGCTFGAGENPNLQLLGARLTLSDDRLPSGTVTGGALGGGGPMSGTQPVAFNAVDNDSGVRLVELLVDGQVVAQNDYGSRCPYSNFQACPATESDTLAWNTASVPDGQHDIALRIINAAGNPVIVDEHPITTANQSAAPGGAAASGSSVLGSSVNWKVSLTITPRRVHRDTVIALTGRVLTSPRPPHGKLIYLQARTVATGWRGRGRKRHRVAVHGHWISFQTLQAKANGSFKAKYRFRLGGRHRYQLRAVAPREGGYRNRTGSSSVVLVTET